MIQQKNRADALRRLTCIAMFAAMAYVLMLAVHIKISFLTFDLKDAVITLCGLYFGPLSALAVSVVVPLIEFATVSDTGIYGLIMNVLGSVSFSVTASLIYKYKKTLFGAILGLISGAFLMVAVMLVANLFITPLFMTAQGMTTASVRDMIPKLLFPFNALKAAVNVGLVLLLYKTLSRALRRAGVLPRRAIQATETPATGAPAAVKSRAVTYIIFAVAVVLIAASMLLIFNVFDGKIAFGL